MKTIRIYMTTSEIEMEYKSHIKTWTNKIKYHLFILLYEYLNGEKNLEMARRWTGCLRFIFCDY